MRMRMRMLLLIQGKDGEIKGMVRRIKIAFKGRCLEQYTTLSINIADDV